MGLRIFTGLFLRDYATRCKRLECIGGEVAERLLRRFLEGAWSSPSPAVEIPSRFEAAARKPVDQAFLARKCHFFALVFWPHRCKRYPAKRLSAVDKRLQQRWLPV